MTNIIFNKITTNYPTQFTAGNTKMEFMAKGLIEQDCKVIALNSSSSTTIENNDQYGITTSGIEYITLNSHKRFKSLRDCWKLYKLLKNRKVKGNNVLIMSTARAYTMLMDILIAKIAGYKTLFLFHEWRSALKMHSIFHKIDAWLKDHLVIRFFDAYLPISHYLLEKCNNVSKKKKKHIVPVLADYSTKPAKHNVLEQFSYCCGVWFIMRHPMLLDAMDKLVECHENAKLILVLSGNEKDVNIFKESIKERKCANNIIIRTKVPFKELNNIYETSLGLIIPLDPNSIADKARFSQKIAEYVATARPIITNSVGEIPYYFKDRESAYFADYSVEGFFNVMKEMLENKEMATLIGSNGFAVGDKHFSYNKSSKQLLDFIKTL